MQDPREARIQLATTFRALAFYGLNEGVDNHVTVRCKSMFDDDRLVMLTLPYMKLWCEAKPGDMIELGLNDKVMITADGVVEMDWETDDYKRLSRQPNMTAFYFHKNVYAACPDVNAIVHTHSMAISVLSATKDFTIEMVHQNSCRFLSNVAYDRSFGGLATADEEAQRVARCITNKEVLLAAHHGAFTMGASLSIAFDHAYFIEIAAKIQLEWMKLPSELRLTIPINQAQLTYEQTQAELNVVSQHHLNAFREKYEPDFV